MNVKNVDIFLNPGQGLVYETWEQSRKYDYPIPESGLTINYPVPGGVDSTFINPEPKKKTFFEFSQTFWHNMINTRNRQFITDGKTGGYPTLQSLFWKYLEQQEVIGEQNNQYTYQKLIDYVNGMGPFWLKLVEQMIPATTIWQGGIRLENSILHRQKFVYRRQRGCQIINKLLPRGGRISGQSNTATIQSSTLKNTANNEFTEIFTLPWLNGNLNVSSFSDILYNELNRVLSSVGQSVSTCQGVNSLTSEWYVDLRIGNNVLINKKFYTGFGIIDTPTNTNWDTALFNFLPDIINSGLTYYLNNNKLKVVNLGNQLLYLNQTLTLNVGININLTC
jgi:hypothetical protein